MTMTDCPLSYSHTTHDSHDWDTGHCPGWAPPTSAPCLACGIAVQHPAAEDIETITSYGHQTVEAEMARCSDCRRIRESAELLMRAWPAERMRIGSASIANHRLELALDALDALGVTDHRVIDALTENGSDIRRLIDFMAVPGGVARFASRFVHAMATGERIDTVAPTRWGGLTVDDRRLLNEARTNLHRARSEWPVPIACPSENGRPSGCLLCGVGAWEALPSVAAYVWVELSADAITIGGQPRPDDLDGHLCPRCDYAVDRADGIGATAMGLSVLDYIEAGVMNDMVAARGIDGLVGWGALRGAAPNSEPWQHVELSGIRSALHASL